MVIGLTGGIGSGKSTALKIFEKLGAKIYSADLVAKDIMVTDNVVVRAIKDLLGEEAYIAHTLNKPYIAEKIFNNATLLSQVNKIVHPRVAIHFEAFKLEHCYSLVVYESAILLEKNQQKNFDKVVLVTAPIENRIERVMKRDGVTRQQVLERIQHQMSEELKEEMADVVVLNDTFLHLENQITELYNQFTNKDIS